jgi:hypothetical protein
MALWRYDRDTESTRWRHPSRRRDFRFATPSVRDHAFGQDRGDPPFPSDSGYQRNPRAGAPSTLVVTIASMLPPHMVCDRCQPPAPWGDPRRLWLARSRGSPIAHRDRPPNLSRRQRGCDLRKRGAQDQNRGGASGMPAGLSTGIALPLSISEPTARKWIAVADFEGDRGDVNVGQERSVWFQ